jgi:nitric oxide dioxygenase
MVSMVEAIAENHPGLPTHYVHGTTNGATHAMDQHVRHLARRHANIHVTAFYSDPAEGDMAGVSHDVTGFISVEWLKRNTPFEAADFYLCGPKAFLRAFAGGLVRAGIPGDRVHYEFFGPAEEILAA